MRALDFGEQGAKAFVANASAWSEGGFIEVRLDNLNGDVIATAIIEPTGGETNWRTVETNVRAKNPITGIHDIYFLFRGGDKELFNFNYWYFK